MTNNQSKEEVSPLYNIMESDVIFDESLLQEKTNEMVNNILTQREKILEAFIAETGLLPSECEQVTQGNKWWIQKRNICFDEKLEQNKYIPYGRAKKDAYYSRDMVHIIKDFDNSTTYCGEFMDQNWECDPYSSEKVTCNKCLEAIKEKDE